MSARLQELCAYYSNRISYEEVAGLVERISGERFIPTAISFFKLKIALHSADENRSEAFKKQAGEGHGMKKLRRRS